MGSMHGYRCLLQRIVLPFVKLSMLAGPYGELLHLLGDEAGSLFAWARIEGRWVIRWDVVRPKELSICLLR